MTSLLEVRDLRTHFRPDDGGFTEVHGIRFAVEAGRTLAIVGGSGCGRRVTPLSIIHETAVRSPPGDFELPFEA